MPQLLIELFSEEIPARMQVRAAEDLQRLVTEKLTAAGLAFTHVEAHSTPRRLALVIDSLPLKQADVTEEKKGPRVGSPETAIQGFLKGAGLNSLNQTEKRQTDKGEFYFAVVKKIGRETKDVLPEIILQAIQELPWPKSMRWGNGDFRWIRPLHSVISIFNGQVVPFKIGPVVTGNQTQGHRFLAPKAFTIKDFDDYKSKLFAANVILDRAERKKIILEEAQKLANTADLKLRDDPGLLEEVAGLVEWPVALIGAIDPQFMDIPAEVLTTSMRTHQRYFALETKDSKLAPRFIVIANRPTSDSGKAVVAGNERVLRARLSDAKFFWDQDCTKPLESHLLALKGITFHDKLGSLGDKVERIEVLAVEIAKYMKGTDESKVRRAARLAKADLVTGVVGEFPEVQGIVGRYIAQKQGETSEVANAIADHYKPLGPSDICPTAPISVAIALADKIDTLVGFFSIDEKPTGSRDPFALRRAALGVIRLIVENRLRLPLTSLFNTALKVLKQKIIPVNSKEKINKSQDISSDLLSFFADRLKVALREKGVRHDLIDAVFALGNEDDLVHLLNRVDALSTFLKTEDGSNLLIAYRRASNIVKIEEKKDSKTYTAAPNSALFQQEEEHALNTALSLTETATTQALKTENFAAAMTALAQLRQPVDSFFDKVTVNADKPEIRANRLTLLARIRSTLNQVADFSRIEG